MVHFFLYAVFFLTRYVGIYIMTYVNVILSFISFPIMYNQGVQFAGPIWSKCVLPLVGVIGVMKSVLYSVGIAN